MVTRHARLSRLRAALDAVVAVAAAPPTEVWLPVKDGGTEVPGRYPMPGGKAVLVLYADDDSAATEEPA
ncbi:hypothetical protein [Urbifossiella limnaea]|uniref:Uncharacterized protein n=1 Tax=Urbifossiella limnaea TaxID=2528023 RepID=A0A517Y1G0_9BACT|nr:hypothetical protein [Urbifossiella limnaea]QDU23606.1 hypothetical protein ETAA1_56100 [Urbifossiella limnaea]